MGREDFAAEIERNHRQPYLGRGLFAGGIVLVLLAVVFAASASIVGLLGLGTTGARELAGALAGIGLAAALVGALAVVPTDRGAWYRGLAGGLLALGGVGAFLFAYPGRWYGDGADLAFSVLAVYAFGTVTTASYLFSAIADLTGRLSRAEALPAAVAGANATENGTEGTSDVGTNETGTNTDPSDGEVLYERTSDPEPTGMPTADAAETGASSSDRPAIDRIESANGDVSWPDSGFVIEPLDRIESTDRSPLDARRPSAPEAAEPDRSRKRDRTPIAVAHNGAATVTMSTTDGRSSGDESLEPTEPAESTGSTGPTTEPTDTGKADTHSPTEHTEPAADGGVDAIQFGPSVDRYCGNCAHFRYVQTDRGLSPYCGYHDEVMDDMDSCFEWTSNA